MQRLKEKNEEAGVLPSLFVSHGAPDLVLGRHPAKTFFEGLASKLPRPRAILAVSAHWRAKAPTLTSAPAPSTLHDFHGWSRSLYEFEYSAKTDSSLIDRITTLLRDDGFSSRSHEKRGFDHGVWIPLMLAYPEADIPIVQMSLTRGDAATHFRVGAAIAPLRDEGVLIVGSGGAVHNLYEMGPEGSSPANWAVDFDNWLLENLSGKNLEELLSFPQRPGSALKAHPTPEHLLPLFVAMGAGWNGAVNRLHQSYSYGSLSMGAYSFGDC